MTYRPEVKSPIPWEAVIAFGLARLRLSPNDFWALSPKELALMATPLSPMLLAVPARTELEALARRYPDGETDGRE